MRRKPIRVVHSVNKIKPVGLLNLMKLLISRQLALKPVDWYGMIEYDKEGRM